MSDAGDKKPLEEYCAELVQAWRDAAEMDPTDEYERGSNEGREACADELETILERYV